ncbi:AhpC/TSA family protein [Pseudoflavitalea sp. G-6-1-2]|uniref:TlpA disulfide reductase family protein n=1 Tax=Pseudoflavitalea sp. G-6-1-2 TaxID=2728841 RepID=UPI00146E72FA|nr:TlpA disulfide reductase family protein [Pseudoflavitalea sp. G-6-1-2]NML22915.1 AhpC/TSA family protein [Pseudoflavitalea sp. G-6-1-2]
MKKNLATLLMIAPAALFAQDAPFTIKGKVGKIGAPAKAYLSYRVDGKNIMDSAELKKGAFEFKGTLGGPARMNVTLNHTGEKSKAADALTFYVEKGNVTLAAKDSIKNAVVKGSSLNEEYKKFQKYLSAPQATIDAINAEWTNASPEKKKEEGFVKSLQDRYKPAAEAMENLQREYIKQNPASYFSLTSIQEIAGGKMDAAEVEPMFKSLSADLQNSKAGKNLAKLIGAARATAVGVQAPEFTQNDVDGKPVKLSDFKGKYVLIDFWASWCGPCRGENPNVVKAYNDYKDKNFTILGISLDSKKENWLKAIEDDKLTWTHVSDLKFWNNEVAVQYGIRGIPANLLLDKDGKIIGKDLRGEELQKKLAEILN